MAMADDLPFRRDAAAERNAPKPVGDIPPFREGRGQTAPGGPVGDFGPSVSITEGGTPFKNLSSKG